MFLRMNGALDLDDLKEAASKAFANALPLRLTGRIVTEGVLIYDGDPPARVEFETATRRHYFDFLPLIERDAREGLLAGG